MHNLVYFVYFVQNVHCFGYMFILHSFHYRGGHAELPFCNFYVFFHLKHNSLFRAILLNETGWQLAWCSWRFFWAWGHEKNAQWIYGSMGWLENKRQSKNTHPWCNESTIRPWWCCHSPPTKKVKQLGTLCPELCFIYFGCVLLFFQVSCIHVLAKNT